MNNATFSMVEDFWTFFSQFSQWFGIAFVLLIVPAYVYKFSWTFEGFKPFEEILFDPILHLFRMIIRFYVTLAGFSLMMLVIGLFGHLFAALAKNTFFSFCGFCGRSSFF